MSLFTRLIAPAGLLLASASIADTKATDAERLVSALLSETPIIQDLRDLTDQIGGRPTGSAENQAAVEWALSKFANAGVSASTHEFVMPKIWLEQTVRGRISGDVHFTPDLVGKVYSATTGKRTAKAPLVWAGRGSEAELAALGNKANGAFLLIETDVLDDDKGLGGLFAEYVAVGEFEPRAKQSGALGFVYMSSRPHELLYRYNAIPGPGNEHLMLIMAREDALRAKRLLQRDKQLELSVQLEADTRTKVVSQNVIGDIRGSKYPDEIVLIGAHLDSHELGTGALDNGSNVTLVLDVARQMQRLGLQPERTIRFALWNGEEQGLFGSAAYAADNADIMDNHVMALSMDIGTGALNGFFTHGQGEKLAPVFAKGLASVAAFGPYTHPDIALSGTDHFDFFLHGVPALVGFQDDANYASNYHAASDTFDKVNQQQLKINAAIVGATIWAFANSERTTTPLNRSEIQALIDANDLRGQMEPFGVWDAWASGERGRNN